MPTSMLPTDTTTGTHTKGSSHWVTGLVGNGSGRELVVVVSVTGAAVVVVTGGLGMLFILVKMKG